MAIIYFDESGDLGFDKQKSKSSKYFVITCLISSDSGAVNKIIKKAFRKIKNNKRKSISNRGQSLHANKESIRIKTFVLDLISKEKDSFTIASLILNKKDVYTKLHNKKHELYNYLSNILLDRILQNKLINLNEPIALVASRRETNQYLNQRFHQYLVNNIKNNHGIPIDIEIKPHTKDTGLQVVDFIAWSVFRKYEYNDSMYFNIIKDNVIKYFLFK
jgi:hypothetical protein